MADPRQNNFGSGGGQNNGHQPFNFNPNMAEYVPQRAPMPAGQMGGGGAGYPQHFAQQHGGGFPPGAPQQYLTPQQQQQQQLMYQEYLRQQQQAFHQQQQQQQPYFHMQQQQYNQPNRFQSQPQPPVAQVPNDVQPPQSAQQSQSPPRAPAKPAGDTTSAPMQVDKTSTKRDAEATEKGWDDDDMEETETLDTKDVKDEKPVDVKPTTEATEPVMTEEELKKLEEMRKLTEQVAAVKVDEKVEVTDTGKEHVNIVFCGHVDAGKSTIGGNLLYLTGVVDKRTLEKFEKEAKDRNRESWFYAWALDTDTDEREKGITVEVGRGSFETATRRFTMLDAPGHKSFVPNMIGGAAQADVAVLVISARRGEFETGFDRGGQTREHAMLVRTAGVKHMIVLVNKMDEPTVQWEEDRYNECKNKLLPFLRKCGFGKHDVHVMPCSGFTGAFLKDPPAEGVCPWYSGPTFLNYLDQLPTMKRDYSGPVRMPIVERYNDMGLIAMGKVECGTIVKGQQLMVMPSRATCEVVSVMSDADDDTAAQKEIKGYAGDNIKLKVKGCQESDINNYGSVLCPPSNPCHTARLFDAQVFILEHKSIICPGYSAVMHIHTAVEEVRIRLLMCLIDKKTGEKGAPRPKFIKQDQKAIVRLELVNPLTALCMETFKEYPQLGRFTIRDENRTIGVGTVLKIIK